VAIQKENKMRKTLAKIGLVMGLMANPSTGLAGTEFADFDLSANVAVTTDYVWRGVSQTGEEPAIQGGFDLGHSSGLYLGAWGSNINFGNTQTTMELDIYGGYATEFANGLGIDVGIIRYLYPGGLAVSELDFTEYYLGLGYSVAKVGLSAKYSYSPDFGATIPDQSAQYLEAGIEYTLPKEITVAAHYGHSFGNAFTTPDSYDDYSFGLSKSLLGLGFDITYYGTDKDGETLFPGLPNQAANTVVFTVSKDF
jgi:uncharacterized protein (TIGR02001 family)